MFLRLKISFSVGMIIAGSLQYFFPEFTGIFGSPIKTSIEHRELIGILVFTAGMILFYMPTDIKE